MCVVICKYFFSLLNTLIWWEMKFVLYHNLRFKCFNKNVFHQHYESENGFPWKKWSATKFIIYCAVMFQLKQFAAKKIELNVCISLSAHVQVLAHSLVELFIIPSPLYNLLLHTRECVISMFLYTFLSMACR